MATAMAEPTSGGHAVAQLSTHVGGPVPSGRYTYSTWPVPSTNTVPSDDSALSTVAAPSGILANVETEAPGVVVETAGSPTDEVEQPVWPSHAAELGGGDEQPIANPEIVIMVVARTNCRSRDVGWRRAFMFITLGEAS